MTNRYPIGEIDLAELLVAIVKTVQRNFWLILTSVVVCTTASIGLHYARPYVPAFESSMLIYTNRAGESYSSRAAFGFSQLRVASDSVKAARLHLDTETAGNW
ncbi:MAG: hypothetical protein HC859_16145 [Bacteroidia bacterium]|nr:hypothetical protein [Bacteroidia bacterium]